MNEWWASLPGILRFFYIVAFSASFVLVFQLILTMIGLGHADTDMDADVSGVGDHDFAVADHDFDMGSIESDHFMAHDAGLHFLSWRTLIAFFVGFGWGGVTFYEWLENPYIALIGGTAIGFAFMLMVFWLMAQIFKLRDYGNISYANAIGKVATVYITIPPKREAAGQVQVVVQGRMREVSAVSDEPERLPPRTKVVITKMLDATTFIVKRTRSEG